MGNGNKVEFLVAICALVSSLAAVFIAWDQARVMRAQQHGAVYPVLQTEGFVSNRAGQRQIGLRISNSGVGPAILESVRLMQADTGLEITDLTDFISRLPDNNDISWSGLAGRAIAPGETVEPLVISWPMATSDELEIAGAMTQSANWQLEICYCSVFARCWQTSEIGVSRAERVADCTPRDEDVFAALGETMLSSARDETLGDGNTEPAE